MKKSKIFELSNSLGLNNKEIDYILNKINSSEKETGLSFGYPCYPGTHYGSISIKDFN